MSTKPKGKVTPMLVTNAINLDLSKLNNGQGVYHFTIRNTGNTSVLLMGVDILDPGETFFMETPFAIVNQHFSIDFMETKEEAPNKRLVIWYATLNCK